LAWRLAQRVHDRVDDSRVTVLWLRLRFEAHTVRSGFDFLDRGRRTTTPRATQAGDCQSVNRMVVFRLQRPQAAASLRPLGGQKVAPPTAALRQALKRCR
jgi:hypothetical protein